MAVGAHVRRGDLTEQTPERGFSTCFQGPKLNAVHDAASAVCRGPIDLWPATAQPCGTINLKRDLTVTISMRIYIFIFRSEARWHALAEAVFVLHGQDKDCDDPAY